MLNGNSLLNSCAAMALMVVWSSLPAKVVNITYGGPAVQDQRQAEWSEIIKLYKQGLGEYKIESQKGEPNYQRGEEIFRAAARKLTQYINRYVKDVNSVAYLRATFRLGTFWEYANEDERAMRSYTACASHPLLNSPSSLFENEPLAILVQARIKEVSKRVSAKRSSKGQTSDARIILRSSKGGSKGRAKDRKLPPPFHELEP